MSLTAKPYDQEDIYDLTIRLYGNINGLSGLINNVTTLDDPVSNDVTYELIEFEDFVESSSPSPKRETIVFTVGENQTIYDLAIQLTGSLAGMADIIDNYERLSDSLKGTQLSVTKKNDPKLNLFLSRGYVFATGGFEDLADLWILVRGFWIDDPNIWIDTETWNDN